MLARRGRGDELGEVRDMAAAAAETEDDVGDGPRGRAVAWGGGEAGKSISRDAPRPLSSIRLPPSPMVPRPVTRDGPRDGDEGGEGRKARFPQQS